MRKAPQFSTKMSETEEIAGNYSVIIAILVENNENSCRVARPERSEGRGELAKSHSLPVGQGVPPDDFFDWAE